MGLRLHVGSATVYLTPGWINVDLPGHGMFLASDRPDLVERFATTEDAYYARHADVTAERLAASAAPLTTESVCDAYGSWDRLPCGIGEAERIVSRHSFEHLSMREARAALDEADRVLAPGGSLTLDVPDHDGTVRWIAERGGDPFSARLLFGSRRNDVGYHVMSYTRDSLRTLVEEHGFVLEREEPNVHFYPSVCLTFRKPGIQAARDYAMHGVVIDPSWKVLDFGPGAWPLARADAYADIDAENLARVAVVTGKPVHLADLNGRLPFEQGGFDFVFASHVLEHTDNPVEACAELSRIARRGIVVLPHAFKDALFVFEEGDHKWWCFPPSEPGRPIRFMHVDYERRSRIANSNVTGALARLIRGGIGRSDSDTRVLRRWWHAAEPDYDIVVPWEGRIEAEIMR